MYLKSVENVITLGKLIGLLFLSCLPLLSILFLKTKRNDLTRPVMGTIFLVVIPWLWQSRGPDPLPNRSTGKGLVKLAWEFCSAQSANLTAVLITTRAMVQSLK